jgi:2-haloacid dehalogenase
MPVVVLWDSLGTLLDVDDVRDLYPGWLERVLHHDAALTLVGDFAPFEQLAEAADPEALRVLQQQLRPYDDVSDALDVLEEAGVGSWIVTNGSRESAEQALGDLASRFGDIVSIDDVESWKPAQAPYREALRRAGADAEDACLIAAHAWDVYAAALATDCAPSGSTAWSSSGRSLANRTGLVPRASRRRPV